MRRAIMSTQRGTRVLKFFVDGTGTAALSGGDTTQATLTDNGTGDYTLTFAEAFEKSPIALASSKTAVISCTVVPSTTAVQILTTDLAGAATDADFFVVVIGDDSGDVN